MELPRAPAMAEAADGASSDPQQPEDASPADTYEKELRERLLETKVGAQEPPRPQRPIWPHLILASIVVTLVVGFALHWRSEARREREEAVAQALEAARFGLARDTHASLRASVDVLEGAWEVAPGDGVLRATLARSLATLAYDYDESAAAWERVRELLAHPAVEPESEPALVARWLLSLAEREGLVETPEADRVPPAASTDAEETDPVEPGGSGDPSADPEEVAIGTEADDSTASDHEALERRILTIAPRDGEAALHHLAGVLHLSRGEANPAIDRFNLALQALPDHVPTLVALGDYYAARREYGEALRTYLLAVAVVEEHPRALIGAAEATLLSPRDEEQLRRAWSGLERIADERAVPRSERDRYALTRARLALALGDREGALAALELRAPGLAEPERLLTWVRAWVEAGAPERAVPLFAGFDLRDPDGDPLLREAWMRLLLAQERFREATELPPEQGGGVLEELAGIAHFHLGELRDGKRRLRASAPPGRRSRDALAYLALIDWREGRRAAAGRLLQRLGTGHLATRTGKWAWAEYLRGERRAEEAEAVLRESLENDGKTPLLAASLGALLLDEGRSGAVEWLEHATRGNPYLSAAWRNLANALQAQGRVEEAKRAWESLLEVRPRSVEAMAGLATLFWQGGEQDAAEHWLEQAQEVDAKHPAVVKGRATLARERGDWEGALRELRAVAPNRRDAELWSDLGDVYLALYRPGPAATAYRRALRLSPGSWSARIGLARAKTFEDKGAAAERELRRLIDGLGEEGSPAARALAHAALAEALLQQGTGFAARAKQEAAKAVEWNDGLPLAHLVLARAWDGLGEATNASRHLQRAEMLAPNLPALALEVGRQRAQSEPEAAAAALRRFLEWVPKGAEARSARRLLASLES